MDTENQHEQRDSAPADREQITARWAVDTALYVGVLYLMLRPWALEQLEDRARQIIRRARHRGQLAAAVWRAKREINELPETDG